jgi:hypothetical protein
MRLLLIAALALPPVAAAPTASFIEFPSFVYDFYLDECPPLPQPGCSLSIAEGCDCDIADAPLRMFRRSGGDGRVFSLASVDLGSRGFAGADARRLEHQCQLYANSTRHASFAELSNYEWIHSTWYFAENNSAVALTHMEWDCKGPETCPWYGAGYSFFSAVTLFSSADGGAHWARAVPLPLPHVVAVSPIPWTEAIGAAGQSYGFRSPSSIVAGRGPLAGWFFATVTAGWGRGSFRGQPDGACMMRTRDLTNPSSWRAWGGAGFDVALSASPYAPGPPPDPAAHICAPFTNSTYLTLAWSSLYGAYMAFGTAGGNDHGGWAFSLSADLISWGAWTPVDVGAFIAPAGNGTVVPTGKALTGRFVKRAIDPEVWYENFERTERRAVGSCTPCPGVPACANLTVITDAEFNGLVERPAFSCGVDGLYNTSGWSDFYYPTLVDAHSPSDNFDEVGATADLFLVGNRCVNAEGGGSGVVHCSPFDVNGLLVRDILRAGVRFS